MNKPIYSHTFNDRKVKIDVCSGQCDGIVDCPYGTDATPVMRIFEDLDTKRGLETVIHETLHVLRWAETEEVVEKTAKELAKFLWRLGYRRIK